MCMMDQIVIKSIYLEMESGLSVKKRHCQCDVGPQQNMTANHSPAA